MGKTTWATKWPNPVFIDTEDGTADVEAHAFPRVREWSDIGAYLNALISEEHKFKTLVIDTVDWLERFVNAYVERKLGVEHIGEVPFGRGYDKATLEWKKLLSYLNTLRDAGMHVLLLSHCDCKMHQQPTGEQWDRYYPALSKRPLPLVTQWCDEILFVNYQVKTKQVESQFSKKNVPQKTGPTEPLCYANETATFDAKNRIGIENPFEFWSVNYFDTYLKGRENV